MKRLILGSLVLGTLVTAAGCFGSFKESICDYANGQACDGGQLPDGTLPDGPVVPEGSTDAKPDADPIPTDCTTPTDPTKNPEKCLVDSFGVFVSPTGDDTKDGTKAK
jgi:hypothetical protein